LLYKCPKTLDQKKKEELPNFQHFLSSTYLQKRLYTHISNQQKKKTKQTDSITIKKYTNTQSELKHSCIAHRSYSDQAWSWTNERTHYHSWRAWTAGHKNRSRRQSHAAARDAADGRPSDCPHSPCRTSVPSRRSDSSWTSHYARQATPRQLTPPDRSDAGTDG